MRISSDKCTGCSACLNICPKNAISLVKSFKGSNFASINNDCVLCGLCYKVCPHNANGFLPFEQEYYGFRSKSKRNLYKSQSGGAFFEFALQILKDGGIVYGVGFKKMRAKYFRVTTKKGLKNLQRSKYIQPEICDTFEKIKLDLLNNKKVLFSGTPCYVSGLKKFLKIKNISEHNLFTIDIICHGYPSNILFYDYLKYYEKKHSRKIKSVGFRDKKYGWNGYTMSLKSSFKTIHNDEFTYIFYSNLGLIEQCYDCKYSNFNRPGDLTIGDFWGVEKFYPSFSDNKGLSLVLINSRKGKELFEQTKESAICFKTEKDKIVQQNLHDPTPKPKGTEDFWNDYMDFGIYYVMEKYCDCRKAPKNERSDFVQKIICCLKKILRPIVRIIK